MKPAPLCMSTYIRLGHLKRTIGALQANTLAPDSVLHIYSDGARPGHETQVAEVRKYLRTIRGFKGVEIVESATNEYPRTLRNGMRSLLEKHGRIISFEEDVVTSPYFLEFMNRALEVYEGNREIFAITGYSPPMRLPSDYAYPVFRLPRFCAWGFGIWKDRFDQIRMPLPRAEVEALLKSAKNRHDFGIGGLDALNMLQKEADGGLDALDAKINFEQWRLGADTLYPSAALTRNIGLDGTGLHSRKHTYKDVVLAGSAATVALPPRLERDPRILRTHFLWRLGGRTLYRRPTWMARLVSFVTYRVSHGMPPLPGSGRA